jgi:peptidoglycan hydrolase-like protein with peptidoglycan-binding domain
MRYIVTTTAMAFIGCLFTAGLVLAAGMSSQMEKEQKSGRAAETMQPQQQVTAMNLDERKVSELQKALNEMGFAVGAVDGIIGPRTMGAIRNFQSQEGLTATGQPDQQTLKALGLEVGQQEFMGVSPEFGEERRQYQPEQMPMERMERMEQMPMQQREQQPQGPGATENR